MRTQALIKRKLSWHKNRDNLVCPQSVARLGIALHDQPIDTAPR